MPNERRKLAFFGAQLTIWKLGELMKFGSGTRFQIFCVKDKKTGVKILWGTGVIENWIAREHGGNHETVLDFAFHCVACYSARLAGLCPLQPPFS